MKVYNVGAHRSRDTFKVTGESLVTSQDGKRNHVSVIQPVENMLWDLMNMMSVQLASET